jgi:hypothetical protein
MPKEILLTEEPVNTNAKITFDEATNTADISHNKLTGYEILEFIENNKDIVNYGKQHEKSIQQHEIKDTELSIYTDSRGDSITIADWINQSEMSESDFKYHTYFMIANNEDSLSFSNLSIGDLLNEEENSNNYFFSGPFVKGLIEKYELNAVITFGNCEANNNSIGFKVNSEVGTGYYDVSYDPPYGSPDKKK